ncbi:tape measure protein [Weissella fangxianensis]|uniref:tape measure protein n=1 Tax=Weissella fangxianensis TaxID=2953879 RepID=UPI0021582B51|nr:tape measure protein [Weissella fangxianensis]
MATEKVGDLLKTDIDIDVTKAENSLKKLQSAVKDSTSEWKQMESQMKQSGDSVSASEAKYKGLSDSVEKQKNVVAKLRYEQQQEKRDTDDSERSYQRYNTQITQAERKLTSMTSQLKSAERSYELQKSGIMSLNKEIKQNVQETDAQVDRLKAEGRASEANKVKHEGLSNTIEKQSKLYKAQKAELDRMEKSGDKSTESISKQRIALNRTGKELAENKTSLKSLNSEMRRTSPNPFVRLSEKIKDTNKHARKTHTIFKQVFSANIMANVAGAAWRNMTMHIGDAVRSGNEYLEQQDKMNAQWKTLAGSTKGAKEMTKGINELASAAQNSAEMVNGLATQFYAVDKNKDQVLELSKATLTLQDAFGATDDAVQNFGKQWSQMMANGKVSAQDFMSFTNVFPALKPALLDYERDITHNSNLTMKQLNDMISQGKISSETMNKVLVDTANKNKEATENFGKTIPGMTRTIQSTMPKLIGEIEKPFYKMKNPLVGSISTWVTDKNTTKEFNKLGKALTEALGNITDAFGGEKLDAGNALDGMLQGLTKSIKNLGKWSKTHKKDIREFFSNFKEKTADTIKILGSTMKAFAVVVTPLIKLMAAHPKIAGTFLAGFMVANKLAAPIAMMGAMAGATKKMFNSFSDKEGIANKVLTKLWQAVKTIGSKIKKAIVWTAQMSTKAAKAAYNGLKKAVVSSAKGVGKALKWTASIATKAAKVALTGLLKTAQFVGKGLKLAFSFLKANPFIMIITGIAAAVAAFAELYKHNKKFRKFVNNIVASVKSFYKNVVKWFKNTWNGVIKTWNSFKKTFTKGFNSFKKSITKAWNAFLKVISKVWSNGWNAVKKTFNKFVSTFKHTFNSFKKFFVDTWNAMKRTVTKIAKSLWHAITSGVNAFFRGFKSTWNKIKSFFHNTWKGMKTIGHDAIWSIKNTFDSVLGKIHKAFSNTWSKIKTGFKDMWDGMKQLAQDGINAVIKIPNKGITGINSLIHDFGGPKHAIGKIPKVAFATGTGAFGNVRRAITKPTLALLNDGNDSPETGNQEMLIHPNGQSELVQGRNTPRILGAGTEVLNAKETAMMMGMQAMPFKSGTGFWSRAWKGVTNVAGNAWSGLKNGVKKFTSMLKFITNAVAHPVKTLNGKLNLNTKGLDAVYKDFGTGFFKKTTGQAKKWWKTLWSMASEASNAGADGGMKGDDYQYKNRVADSMPPDKWGYFIKECVSFVASRLANSGVPAHKFSHLGNGSEWVNAKVPHMSKPKVGSVAVYGPGSEFGNHVAMVTGVQGDKISGEEYNWLGKHAYHKYHGRNASGATTFLDFGLGGSSKAPEVKANSPMAKLIKRQTGGMMKWIQKFISPLNESSTGKDGDVHSWSDDVKKALNKLGLSTSAAMVQKVLRQISTESGGNPKARQPGADPDGDGSGPALGLMQTKRSTFNANALSGHKNIFNGYDNILAGLNYARKRYGDSLSFLGNGHGYENGGLISNHGMYEIAERNMPEMVIPLAAEKKSRANQLLTEANERINGKSTDDSLVKQLIELMKQWKSSQDNQGDTYEININVNADTTLATLKKIQQAVEDAITRKQSAKTRVFGG